MLLLTQIGGISGAPEGDTLDEVVFYALQEFQVNDQTPERKIDVDRLAEGNPAIDLERFKEWRRKMRRVKRAKRLRPAQDEPCAPPPPRRMQNIPLPWGKGVPLYRGWQQKKIRRIRWPERSRDDQSPPRQMQLPIGGRRILSGNRSG